MKEIKEKLIIRVCILHTPQGWGALGATREGLCAFAWPYSSPADAVGCLKKVVYGRRKPILVLSMVHELNENDSLYQAASELLFYLTAGKCCQSLQDFSIDWSWYSLWQKQVYRIVCLIPKGEVRSYGWVARQCGKPTASRAVGKALAANNLPLFIPCHRVIYSSGRLGNYCSRENLQNLKKFLLILDGYQEGTPLEEGGKPVL